MENDSSGRIMCLRVVWVYGWWRGSTRIGTVYITETGTNIVAVWSGSTNDESISTLKECLMKDSVMIRCHKTVPAPPGYFQWRRNTVRDDLLGNSWQRQIWTSSSSFQFVPKMTYTSTKNRSWICIYILWVYSNAFNTRLVRHPSWQVHTHLLKISNSVIKGIVLWLTIPVSCP